MYRLTIDKHTQAQLDALPTEGQQAWRALRVSLELTPGNGNPLHPNRPKGILSWQFSPNRQGLAYSLVVKHTRQVAVLEVLWSS